MTTYIMILFISAYGKGGAVTVEFSSLEACRNAMSVVEGRFENFLVEAFAVCVPKELEE